MPKVFDCFPFFNELELLELRLNELNDMIDFFVLVEATASHRGNEKPLIFQQNKDRFSKFLHKIVHVVVDDMPRGGTSEPERWARENFQRQAILRGLGAAHWRDFVIVSDLDEIPRPGAIAQVLREGAILPTRYAFEMKAYWYFLNLEHADRWTMAAMARRAHLIDVNQFRLFGQPWITPRRQPKRLAKTIKYFGSPMRWKTIPNGGWHFTFMNGPEAVREKLFHYPHVTPDDANTLGAAQTMIDNAISGSMFAIREVDEQFPTYLRRNPGRFSHMLTSAETFVSR
jgi:beta-1,4-mannosyl-glycoprotein beta-1,4-N-acetylglucosaminyltransferase